MLQSKYKVGSLDKRVTFQQKIFDVDESNQKTITGWENIATNPTVFASVDETNGSEVIQAEQLNGLKTSIVHIRYRSDLTSENRMIYNGEKYDIKPPLEIGRKQYLKIIAVSGGKYT